MTVTATSPVAAERATTWRPPTGWLPAWTWPRMRDSGASEVSTPLVEAPAVTAITGAFAASVIDPEKRVVEPGAEKRIR